GLVAGGERVLGQGGAPDRHVVEPAGKGVAGPAAVAAAQHEIVGVADGRPLRRPAQVPRPRGGLAIDVGAEAFRLAEDVSDGNVVPAGGGETLRGRPAVPLGLLAVARRAGEQEAETLAGFVAEQAEGVVLVLLRKAVPAVAALADQVGVTALLQLIDAHPRLQCDRVAPAETQVDLRYVPLADHQARLRAREPPSRG